MINFPKNIIENSAEYFTEYFKKLSEAASEIDQEIFNKVVEEIENTISRSGTIYTMGNGGSASISGHLLCDYVKGISTDTSLKPKVISLSSENSILTAIANDISFDDIFSFQLHNTIKSEDLVIAISSSGNSKNIIKALNEAKNSNVTSILFCGFDGGLGKKIADYAIHFPINNYGITEDLHQMTMHTIAQYLRMKNMRPEDIESKKF